MSDPPPIEIAQRSIHLGLHRSWASDGAAFCVFKRSGGPKHVNQSLQGLFALMIMHIDVHTHTHARVCMCVCMDGWMHPWMHECK